MSLSRNTLAATSVGNYALFGGGNDGRYRAMVDAYSDTLVRSTPTDLSKRRSGLAATSVGNYGLFGGGRRWMESSEGPMDVVDAYSDTLVRSTPTGLSEARSDLAATTVGNYGLFGGGKNNGSYLSTVDAYTIT